MLSGFDMGAEDYVTKPFNMQILLRRVEVVLRRVGVSSPRLPADRWTRRLAGAGLLRADRAAGAGKTGHHPQ